MSSHTDIGGDPFRDFSSYFDNYRNRSSTAGISPLHPLFTAPQENYFSHYTLERNHQGLDNELIEKSDLVSGTLGAIKRKERIGGILSY